MATPTAADLASMAQALQFPVSFFEDSVPLYQAPEGRFRKLAKAPAAAKHQLPAQARLIADAMDRGCRELGVRRLLLHPWEGSLDEESIRQCAREARAQAGLGPSGAVPNATRACEALGVPVAIVPPVCDAAEMSGFSVWGSLGDVRPLIVVVAGQPGAAQRATVAHELGHLALHTFNQHVEEKEADEQAWAFANELLVPEEDLWAAFATREPMLSDLLKLKGRYGVSVSFLIMECTRLGIIDEARKRSLFKQRSARGWTKGEPGHVGSETATIVPTVLAALADRGEDVGMQEFLRAVLAKSGQPQRRDGAPGQVVEFARG